MPESCNEEYKQILFWLQRLSDESLYILSTLHKSLPEESYFYPNGQKTPTLTIRQMYGYRQVLRLGSALVSLERVLPQSRYFMGESFWDLPSACTLIRTIVDAYCKFHYLAVDKVPEHEEKARHDLWELCYRSWLLRLDPNKPSADGDRRCVESLKMSLSANSFFSSFSPKEQRKYLKGKDPTFLSPKEIAQRAGLNPDFFDKTWQYLCAHVHSGFSFLSVPLIFDETSPLLSGFCQTLQNSLLYGALAFFDFCRLMRIDESEAISRLLFRYRSISGLFNNPCSE